MPTTKKQKKTKQPKTIGVTPPGGPKNPPGSPKKKR